MVRPVDTTTEQEAAIAAGAARFNAEARAMNRGHVDETPDEFFARVIAQVLNGLVQRYRTERRAAALTVDDILADPTLSAADRAVIQRVVDSRTGALSNGR